MKRIKTILMGVAAVGAGGFVLASILFFPPSFLTVREVVVVSPLHRISEMDLVRLSEVEKGDNLVRLRLAKVREKLLRYPWVKEVRLSKNIPGRLQLWVEEEIPVALLDVEGLYLVNAEGKVFKKVEPGDPRDFPVMTGLKKEDLPFQLKNLVGLIRQFDTLEDLKPIGISEVRWNREKGIALFTKEPCVRVEMGNRDWAEGLQRLGAVWSEMMSSSVRPKTIDLSLKKRIVVKLSLLLRGRSFSPPETPIGLGTCRIACSVWPSWQSQIWPILTSYCLDPSDYKLSYIKKEVV